MEIIFTLILLIGFGLNSHRVENKKQDFYKEKIASVVEQKTTNKDSKNEQDFRNELQQNKSDAVKNNFTVNKPLLKGKYISVRIGNKVT